MAKEEHPVHSSSCHIVSLNCKTHKSRSEYEIEYDLYKIAQKNKKPKKHTRKLSYHKDDHVLRPILWVP